MEACQQEWRELVSLESCASLPIHQRHAGLELVCAVSQVQFTSCISDERWFNSRSKCNSVRPVHVVPLTDHEGAPVLNAMSGNSG